MAFVSLHLVLVGRMVATSFSWEFLFFPFLPFFHSVEERCDNAGFAGRGGEGEKVSLWPEIKNRKRKGKKVKE